MLTEVSRRLLEWYKTHARVLPWRGHPDPYAVWVSEIMLQQTRVETVIPYFERWMRRFPTLADLAAAPQQDVLHCWEGLGYYSRARNLHRAAQVVMEKYAGNLPSNRAGLEALPGIGAYTAGAIASMAFGRDEAALDGNIRRVMARLFNVDVLARSPEGQRRLWELAEQNLPPGSAGDYNQALMDLGSEICLPRQPLCEKCPLKELCEAHSLGVEAERPVMETRRKPPHYLVAAAVIEQDNRVLIARRPAEDMLGGLWEFPGGRMEEGESLEQTVQREIQEELGTVVEVGDLFGIYRHAYTHFSVTLHAFRCRIMPQSPAPQPIYASELSWVEPQNLAQYPMGKIDRMISRDMVERLI